MTDGQSELNEQIEIDKAATAKNNRIVDDDDVRKAIVTLDRVHAILDRIQTGLQLRRDEAGDARDGVRKAMDGLEDAIGNLERCV